MTRPRAFAVVVVGSEILRDGRADTNGPHIEATLQRAGYLPVLRQVVCDDREAIAEALRISIARAPITIVSGGLGPTFDDLTREGTADAMGLALARDAAIEAKLRERFRRRGLTPPESVYRMADVLVGATPLRNRVGSAPGLLVEGPPTVALLPGVPAEMTSILEAEVVPRLLAIHAPSPGARRVFKIAGLYESEVESLVAPQMASWSAIECTILAAPGEVTLILRAPAERSADLESAGRGIEAALGEAVFSSADEGIEWAVSRDLAASNRTLSTAESCTGGMLGELITSVPGASRFYVGGAVAYANAIKEGWLDVRAATLCAFGAVSAEVAAEMAEGARRRTGADLALAITGVAGPDASEAKPVGLVHVALAAPWGGAALAASFPGDRASIRIRSCRAALNLLRLELARARREGRA